MRTFSGNHWIGTMLVVLVAAAILFAGCTSQPGAQPTPAVTVSPTTNPGQNSPTPADTNVEILTASLPYGINISYPENWERRDVLASGATDYGKKTEDVVNLFSPYSVPGDLSSYTTLSINIDKNPGGDARKYFNEATLALGNTYNRPVQVSPHISTPLISGIKSYQLDFQTADTVRSYIFTPSDNAMFIFAFKGPNSPAEVTTFKKDVANISGSIRLRPVTVIP